MTEVLNVERYTELMIEAIYCDVHGTLVNFLGAWAEVAKVDLSTWKRGAYSVEEALGIDEREFWHPILECDAGWWAELPLMPMANALVDTLRDAAPVRFVSSPRCPARRAEAGGTTELVHECFCDDVRLVRDKSELAARNRLLVDDSDEQCDAWRRAGGRAILVPRPWNSAADRADRSLLVVTQLLAELGTIHGGFYRIRLPLPPPELRPNSAPKSHGWKRKVVSSYLRECRQMIWADLRSRNVEPPRWKTVEITPEVRTESGRAWDAGNLFASLKQAEDALEREGVITNDRGVVWMPPRFVAVSPLQTGVVLTVEATSR